MTFAVSSQRPATAGGTTRTLSVDSVVTLPALTDAPFSWLAVELVQPRRRQGTQGRPAALLGARHTSIIEQSAHQQTRGKTYITCQREASNRRPTPSGRFITQPYPAPFTVSTPTMTTSALNLHSLAQLLAQTHPTWVVARRSCSYAGRCRRCRGLYRP